METLGQRISYLIKELGLTKTKFAEPLHVSPAFISMICSGAKQPSDRTVLDICREFGVSEQWLREGCGEMFPPRTRAQEIADLAADLLSDEPDSIRSVFISYLCKWDADDWQAVAGIIKKHGFPRAQHEKAEPND